MKKLLFVVLLSFMSVTLYAQTTEEYLFENNQQQVRFENLIQKFRCLVCQNETLADSNAPLAQDLRGQIAFLIKQNKNDNEITEYLVQRYGNFILFKPPLMATTYLLWFGPFIMLIAGIIIIIKVARK